ncbi:hypothetical protein MTX78_11875 [Hymenobacter tibetensis]|uniref:ASCH domain-containing protein n=1 Tax=Hymenobacter tibetensis TaxID=497967 RepID=A0ABY4CUG1_9BACT|nr:hypothetical protein [Hymenobacter tibetensis]UOG72825.1 hypothetical protein MTX78_11875 [Hymenobacter tibetensis]
MRVISFNAAMLAAVQAGYKTVTRRRFAPHLPLQLHPNWYRYHSLGEEGALFESTQPDSPGWLPRIPCPFGRPGELLQVQEDASLVIKVKSIRAEQVRNLTDADALAEGVQEREVAGHLQWGGVEPDPDVPGHYRWYDSPVAAFRALLNSIYPTAWERNEWVWVVTFA